MSVLSKLLMDEWSLPYSCYELGHTFTPFCTESSVTISTSVFRESLKMYSMLYFLTQIIFVRRYSYQNFKITLQSILRSTSFLTFNARSTLSLFCLSRHLAGKFYLPIVSHLPAILSSFASIKIEREDRRSALAFYCCNVAMETIIFGNLNAKNNIEYFARQNKSVSKKNLINYLNKTTSQTGFVYLIFNVFRLNNDEMKKISMYLFDKHDKKLTKRPLAKTERQDLVCIVFKHLIGKNEFDDNNSPESLKIQDVKNNLNDELKDKKLIDQVGFKKLFSKLFSYDHKTSSRCFENDQISNCLKSSISCSFRGLTIGFLTNFTLISIMHLKNNKFKLKNSFWSLLTHQESFKFGLFLGSFNCLYKLFNCLLHKIEEKKSNWHSAVSSIASIILPKMIFGKKIASPNLNLTQYLFWKSIENWFWHFARAHQQKKDEIHKKYIQIIEEEMSKKFVQISINQKDINDPVILSSTKPNSSLAINLNKNNQLSEKINKLTVNDTLQLNELADKLTQIESKQQFSIFNYISSDTIISLIYSLSVSQLFYVAVMQPAKLRGSYMKFLDRCTDNRFRLLNRNIIDFFGVSSSVGCVPHEPVLDFNFTTRKYQEAIQIWSI